MENYYSRIKALVSHPLWKNGRVFLLSFLIGLTSLDTYGQARTVSGKVTASDDGSSLPGVTLIIKGTTQGTVTDIDGNFSIDVESDDAVLVASFVGYKTMEKIVGAASQINFDLELDVETLEEVVVVGYGTQKKSDLTGAVASVTGDALRGTVTASVDQALQGRVAGVQVTQNSGQPGGAVSIRVRGTTSINGSSEPLYVIDGVQIGGEAQAISGFDWQGGSGGQQQNVSNPLASINPADIESIEVLKDASATAIYGSRAANGVVIITTKRGKKGEATVSYNGYYAIQEVAKTHDMMDLPSYAAYNNEVADEVQGIEPTVGFEDPSLLGRGTDWQAAVFQVAPMQSHTISVAGGTEKTQYMVSGGYFEQEGIIIGSNFDRFNVRLNLDSEVKDGFKVGASLSYARKDENITLQDGGDGVISQALQMPPSVPVRNFDGSYAGPAQQNASSQIGSNPVALALLRTNTVLNDRYMINLYGDLEIIQGLNFRSEIALDNSSSLNKAFVPTYEWGSIVNAISQLGQRQDASFNWIWKNYATYNKSFGAHNLVAMAGTEAQKSQYEGFVTYKINLPNDLPVLSQGDNSELLTNGWKGWSSLASYFTRVVYNFDDRYLATATARWDGSSKFGPNNRWGFFPSASLAWRVSNESFLSSSDVVSNLKLRFGWGIVGNQNIPNYAFGSDLTTLNSYFGVATRNGAYSNPNVQWEETNQLNVGLDLSLWQGRLDLTLDAYQKTTDNLLLEVNLPAPFGGQVAGPQSNVGVMENKGFEIGLNAIPVDAGKFRWNLNANFSVNRNEVVTLDNDLNQAVYWYSGFQTATWTTEGRPIGQFYGFIADGIFTSEDEILNHAVQISDPNYVPVDENDPGQNLIDRQVGLWLGDVKWRDVNGDGIINSDDQTFIGDPNPDFTFGFNNTFTYGPFALDVYMVGSYGGDILNFSRVRNEQMISNFDNQSVTVQNRARTELIDPAGDPNNIADVRLVDPNGTMPRFDNGAENNNHYMSTRWLEDGSYLRIQNIKLAYTLPSALTQKARISRVQVYANVQNAFTFTNYTGLDPQIGAFDQSSLRQNIDMGRYPLARAYTFGINVDF